jgi:hypothetical protein
MDRRALLLGSIPALLIAGYAGSGFLSPKSDLELLEDSDLLLFPRDPEQTAGGKAPFIDRGAMVMPFARFAVSAVVLSARAYDLGDDSQGKALPFDLALGWGPMSSPWVISHVDIFQRGRFYFWYVPGGSPIQPSDVITSSSNMHIFPADTEIEKRLSGLGRGSMVRLEGWLADIEIDGRKIRSSRNRIDTGPGACEIVVVERLLIGASEIRAASS